MTRKTVIFIVEGNTDKTALENIFRKIYKNKNINVEVTQGDITSDAAIKDEDLENVIFSLVKNYMDDKNFVNQIYGRLFRCLIRMELMYQKQLLFREIQKNSIIQKVQFLVRIGRRLLTEMK